MTKVQKDFNKFSKKYRPTIRLIQVFFLRMGWGWNAKVQYHPDENDSERDTTMVMASLPLTEEFPKQFRDGCQGYVNKTSISMTVDGWEKAIKNFTT